jgi:hypothetical protein
MDKRKAIELLGGTPTSAAAAIGITVSAVSQWEDVLSDTLADRVVAAIARKHLPPALIGGKRKAKRKAKQKAKAAPA